MSKTRFTAVLGSLAMLALAGGCVVVGGSTTRSPPATVGQQLIDLKRAQQDGAISAEEFERMRGELVNRGTTTPN